MKLDSLLSKVLDGQKLVDNMTEESKKLKKELPPEPKEPTATPTITSVSAETKVEEKVKPVKKPLEIQTPAVNEAEINKQKHDEEIAAKIKAQIKPKAPANKQEPPAKTMSVPNFAKLRELAKQARQSSATPPAAPSVSPLTPPVATTVEETSAKTDTSQT
jgi:hypothetical protein